MTVKSVLPEVWSNLRAVIDMKRFTGYPDFKAIQEFESVWYKKIADAKSETSLTKLRDELASLIPNTKEKRHA